MPAGGHPKTEPPRRIGQGNLTGNLHMQPVLLAAATSALGRAAGAGPARVTFTGPRATSSHRAADEASAGEPGERDSATGYGSTSCSRTSAPSTVRSCPGKSSRRCPAPGSTRASAGNCCWSASSAASNSCKAGAREFRPPGLLPYVSSVLGVLELSEPIQRFTLCGAAGSAADPLPVDPAQVSRRLCATPSPALGAPGSGLGGPCLARPSFRELVFVRARP